MTRRETAWFVGVAIVFVLLAGLPFLGDNYLLTIGISIAMYGVLATSWALFSGPTHYISLATAAFYGLGAYTVAVGIESLPYALLVLLAAIGGAVLAFLVGWPRCVCRACTSSSSPWAWPNSSASW